MKQIVLIDFQGSYVASALAAGDVKISLLITNNAEIAQRCQETFGNKIQECWWGCPDTYEEWERLTNSEYDLSYEDIKRYRNVQLKLERYYHRVAANIAEIKFIYYTLLKKFLGFFRDHQIDMVFSSYLEHGAIDSLIMGIAKHRGIPCFSLTSYVGVSDRFLYSIIDQNKLMIMDIGQWGLTTFSEQDVAALLEKVPSFYMVKRQKTFKMWRRCKKKLLKNWLNAIVFPLRARKEPRKFLLSDDGMPREEALSSFAFVEKLKKYYNHISTQPDLSQKYIFYALHQDPEATTMVRTTMESQLFIIRTLSRHLPPGYKLYVKEHPSTFSIYEKYPYFLRNIRYFRDFSFYEYIKKFSNVELVSMDIPTSSLIENASAVSSICGTIFFESILRKKPIIVWGENTTIAESLSEAWVIRSEKKLKDAMDKLSSCRELPYYEDFGNILTYYTFSDGPNDKFNEGASDIRAKLIQKLLEYPFHNNLT